MSFGAFPRAKQTSSAITFSSVEAGIYHPEYISEIDLRRQDPSASGFSEDLLAYEYVPLSRR